MHTRFDIEATKIFEVRHFADFRRTVERQQSKKNSSIVGDFRRSLLVCRSFYVLIGAELLTYRIGIKKTVVALFRVEIHTSVTIAMFRIYYFTKFRRKCRSFVFFWKFVCITSKNKRQLFHLVLRSREIRNFMKFDKSIRYLEMQREHRPLGVTFSLI